MRVSSISPFRTGSLQNCSVESHPLRQALVFLGFTQNLTSAYPSVYPSCMKVNLTKLVHTPEGRRFCPVVFSRGKLRPDMVLVKGVEERHPEGVYYLDWKEKGKRHRMAVPRHVDPVAAKGKKELEFAARKQGVPLPTDNSPKTLLATATAVYLDEVRSTKKKKTWQAYTVSLGYFLESCPKTYVEEIDRADLIRFFGFLRSQKKQSPRSCANKFENVMTFLKAQGMKIKLRKTDWPNYVESEVEIYEKAELDKLFAASTDLEKLYWQFLLTSGLREQEFIYLTWSDINFEHGTVTVNWKPTYNWSPKQYKGREIPLPSKTLEMLKKHKETKEKARPGNGQAKGGDLVFPTGLGNPNGHLLRTLKRLAKRAGLDPERVWLHKFRSTFATTCLASGIDLRTVQAWMGHTDLASTLRYLKPARSEQIREKVEATFA